MLAGPTTMTDTPSPTVPPTTVGESKDDVESAWRGYKKKTLKITRTQEEISISVTPFLTLP